MAAATTRVISLVGASILRTHHHLTPLPLIRFPTTTTTKLFPFPALKLHCHYSSPSSSSAAAVVLDSDTTNTNNSSPETIVTAQFHHPWPEWVNFVDRLKTKGYFLEFRVQNWDSCNGVVYKDMTILKDVCLRFARDRYDIFKSLSMENMKTLVEKGCPNILRKTVNSGKRLRAYVHLDEGDVCSGCNWRESCDRAYVILKDVEATARTVDIVRILLNFALDPLVVSGEMPAGREIVELSARKLLSELTELSETIPDPELPPPAAKVTHRKERSPSFTEDESSRNVEMKRGDWMCPKCNFMNFARNTECLKCRTKAVKRVDDDNFEMKKGDWNCPQCSFMNFAKNTQCLKCKGERPRMLEFVSVEMKRGDWNCPDCRYMNFASNTKCKRCQGPPPKKQLNPGEWECPSCNFLNFKRNATCPKCNCERPKEVESEYEEQMWKKPF